MACPHCGAVYDSAPAPPEKPPADARRAPKAPVAEETEQIAYIGVPGGAKRPITVVPEVVSPVTIEGPPLRSLITQGPGVDRLPPEPLSEDSRRAVTITAVPAAPEAPSQAAPEIEEALSLPEPAPAAPEPATTIRDLAETRQDSESRELAEGTNLPSTVVVMAPSPRPPAARIMDDTAELERVIDAAVAKAFREHALALAKRQESAAAAAMEPAQTRSRVRLALVGVSLLAGGLLGDLLVMNWDTWVRGEAANAVGWIQQSGMQGMAAVVGAGVAAALLAASRGKRRAARAPQIPG